jgi:HEAT repeat protein
MGKLIQELGEMLLNKDSDHARKAGRALLTVADTRTIKHWVKGLRTRGYGIKLKAIAGLGKYKTDAALAGLAHCRKDKNTNVRQSCAQALSSSPHPKAWPALLAMKADPYTGVRLTVLHALAKRPCAQTAKLIRKMTRDPAKLVKNEAKRYLKRCGRP